MAEGKLQNPTSSEDVFLESKEMKEIFGSIEKEIESSSEYFDDIVETTDMKEERIAIQKDMAFQFNNMWNNAFMASFRKTKSDAFYGGGVKRSPKETEKFESDLQSEIENYVIPNKINITDSIASDVINQILRSFSNRYTSIHININGFKKYLVNNGFFDKFYVIKLLLKFLPYQKSIGIKIIILSEVGSHKDFISYDRTPSKISNDFKLCEYVIRRSFNSLIKGSVATLECLAKAEQNEKIFNLMIPVVVTGANDITKAYTYKYVAMYGGEKAMTETFSDAVEELKNMLAKGGIGCQLGLRSYLGSKEVAEQAERTKKEQANKYAKGGLD